MQKHIGRRDFVRIGGGTALSLGMGSSLQTTRAATTVSYGTPGGSVEDEAWKPVFEAFNESQSEIEALYMPLGGNYGPEYLQNLQARVAADNAPDLFFIPEEQVAAFADRNVIVPVGEYVESSGVKLDEFFDAHIQRLTYRDKLWGLPRDGAPVALYYNADMFDEAGVSYPDETWDWNTFLTAAQTLTKRDEGGRAQQLGTARGEWVNWVWQAGGDVLNEDNTQCLLAEPAAIEGLRFLQDLVLEHQVAPSAEDLADQEEADMFIAGRLAMYFAARGGLGAICNGAAFRFSAAVPPKGEVRAARTNVGPTVLWSGSKNPEAAFEFMKFMTSAEGQKLKISTGYAFPSRISSTYEEWFTGFQCAESIDDGINIAFRKEIEEGWVRTWPTHPRWPEISTAITEELDALFLGNKTPEQVGQDIATRVDRLLSEST
jgi:multiple sugar transport system substrate-binding protein